MSGDDLWINDRVGVPLAELTYRASRSGGPGGQHVNTSSTRIELRWDLAGSPSLTETDRARALSRLANRLDSTGCLRLVSSGTRSQLQNRQEVTQRFQKILADALRIPKRRKKTRPPRAAAERRLATKKKRARLKQERRPRAAEE